jgi:hypothetical protein
MSGVFFIRLQFLGFKTSFRKEAYLELNKFELRKTICKFRISAHTLNIETERSQNICGSCQQNKTDDELHFLLECPLYHSLRQYYFRTVILYCPNFSNLDNKAQFNWQAPVRIRVRIDPPHPLVCCKRIGRPL